MSPHRSVRPLSHRLVALLLAALALLAGHGSLAAAPKAQPAVTATRPANNATNVPRDAFIGTSVTLPNGAIDPTTVTTSTVKLYRSADYQPVPAVRNTSGGGDVIVVQPQGLLDANTRYTYEVTSGLKDVSGAGFTPFTMSFTTGTSYGQPDTSAVFQQVALPTTINKAYTDVVIGPDGKLYAAAETGQLLRYTINADGTLGAAQAIETVRTANGSDRFLIGLLFDKTATAGNLKLWISHSAYGFSGSPDWTGKISLLSGPNLENITDYVVNLPRSAHDHVTNQLAYGPDGAIYFPQGSNSAMGAPDAVWDARSEHLLTAAILRLDVSAITSLPLDVKTDEGGSYNPFAPGAPLTVYASGIRNAYDLVWHSNGHLYVPANGSAAGGGTLASPNPVNCTANRIDYAENGAYSGPVVPGIAPVNEDQDDFLFDVARHGYYGHPNAARCEWVLNGGNPTAGADTAQVSQYPEGTLPDRNWRGAAYDFGLNYSPDGALEYRSGVFGGALLGKILVVRYSGGDDIVALTPGSDGSIINFQSGIVGFTGFNDPLDLVENPANGNIYVAEYGGEKLTLLRPQTGSTPTVTTTSTASATRTATVTASATRTASATASVTRTTTATASATSTASATRTATATTSPTRTITATPSLTRTATAIATTTRTATRTVTLTLTPSLTRTPSPTLTRTVTVTPSRTATRTATPTPGGVCSISYRPAGLPITIPDEGTITSTLTVADSGIVGSVTVSGLKFQHPYSSDLEVYLISPQGARVELISDECSAGNWTSANTGFTLADSAAANIGAVCPPAQGAYKPEESLAVFAGQQAKGAWKLEVSDIGQFDTGTLNDWTLNIKYASGGCTGQPTATKTPTKTVTPTPTITATRTATRTVTATRTATRTITATRTVTRTVTAIRTATRTATPTITPTQGPPVCAAVSWTALVNVAASGGTLTKNGGVAYAWDAGAISSQSLASGNGYVEATIDSLNTYRMFGLGHTNSNASYSDIEYAAYLAGDTLLVYESDVLRGSFGELAIGDVVRVTVEGGKINYYLNGALVYASTLTPVYPLSVDSSIADPGGKIQSAQWCVGRAILLSTQARP